LPLLGSALESLRDIVVLPGALGVHACECGHPEMRRLPDGVYHCPACGSEVLPTETAMKLVQDTAHSISVRVSD
jgi:ribosomal protein L37AE/L43A